MKLPKRLSSILKEKQEFINSQRDRLEKSVIRLQSALFNDIISELIPELEVKDGFIRDTPKNYRLLSVLDKTYKDFKAGSNQVILGQIISGTSKVSALSAKYFSALFTDLPERFEKIVEKTDKLINLRIGIDGGKTVKGGFLESFLNSNTVGTDLKQMTSKAVTSNMNLKEFIGNLKEKLTGSADYTGAMEREFQKYAYDIYQQYDSAYNMVLGNEFGFTYFIYQGGLIIDSRDFCAAHNNKVWSVEEAKDWGTWTPSQGEYPAGYEIKAKDLNAVPSYIGYAGYDPLIDKGGYNCRHSLGWISDEMAQRLRPDLKI